MTHDIADRPQQLSGTIRACKPDETLERIKPYLSLIGVTRIADITDLDIIGIPVFLCYRPNAKSLICSQGKGLNSKLSKISAYMEAMEHYHSENIRATDLTGSYATLSSTYPMIDPNSLRKNVFFKESLTQLSMSWIKASELTSGNICFVPHTYCNFDTTRCEPLRGIFYVSTTGLAAGNTMDEALCHALCEIIERTCNEEHKQKSDSEKETLRIDLSSIVNADLQILLDKFKSARVNVRVYDATNKIGIPTFNCLIHDTLSASRLPVFSGWGTHPEKNIALIRALTEAAQSRLTLISGSRDDLKAPLYKSYQPVNDISVSQGK